MDAHLALGRYGEELASRYLRERGMQVLERNWRCPEGEIDIVALDGDCLVVCEVKTRAGTGAGDPVEAVTWEKANRLRRLAAAYLRSRPGSVARARIDVIGVLAERGRPPVVRHVVAVGS
ncbi:YraN family protein [Knoellia locipacati]|nr:YraN family protein [Knoellia locipacati]